MAEYMRRDKEYWLKFDKDFEPAKETITSRATGKTQDVFTLGEKIWRHWIDDRGTGKRKPVVCEGKRYCKLCKNGNRATPIYLADCRWKVAQNAPWNEDKIELPFHLVRDISSAISALLLAGKDFRDYEYHITPFEDNGRKEFRVEAGLPVNAVPVVRTEHTFSISAEDARLLRMLNIGAKRSGGYDKPGWIASLTHPEVGWSEQKATVAIERVWDGGLLDTAKIDALIEG